ncbi:MAG: hypothetical protein U0232_20910 [Thermomicrobiales bacterium]
MDALGRRGRLRGPARRTPRRKDPLEHERLWQKMYRFMAYYGRQGAGMQILSGADIALWDIAGKALGQPSATARREIPRHRPLLRLHLFRPTPKPCAKPSPTTWRKASGRSSSAGASSAATSRSTSPG